MSKETELQKAFLRFDGMPGSHDPPSTLDRTRRKTATTGPPSAVGPVIRHAAAGSTGETHILYSPDLVVALTARLLAGKAGVWPGVRAKPEADGPAISGWRETAGGTPR